MYNGAGEVPAVADGVVDEGLVTAERVADAAVATLGGVVVEVDVVEDEVVVEDGLVEGVDVIEVGVRARHGAPQVRIEIRSPHTSPERVRC